jgi:hypothetical protein
MAKVWFAEKQNGEVIELTEIEALTHFENNNVARRMGLRFLGTSDGTKFAEAKLKAKNLVTERLLEAYPTYNRMNLEEKRITSADFRENMSPELRQEVKDITDAGYQAELEQAKANGVQRPDASSRIITVIEGQQAVGQSRNKVLGAMNGN